MNYFYRFFVFFSIGRQGKPKRKKIFCDPHISVLMWQSEYEEEEEGKDVRYINISDIRSVRLGTEIDPFTSENALQVAVDHGEIELTEVDKLYEEKKMLDKNDKCFQKPSGGFLSGLFTGKDKDTILYGTPNLRRTCKPEEMRYCVSLILEDR